MDRGRRVHARSLPALPLGVGSPSGERTDSQPATPTLAGTGADPAAVLAKKGTSKYSISTRTMAIQIGAREIESLCHLTEPLSGIRETERRQTLRVCR